MGTVLVCVDVDGGVFEEGGDGFGEDAAVSGDMPSDVVEEDHDRGRRRRGTEPVSAPVDDGVDERGRERDGGDAPVGGPTDEREPLVVRG